MDDGCRVCRELRLEGPREQVFTLAPRDGGGWDAWADALLRFVRRIGHQPTRALVITQLPCTERYVQGHIGHGIVDLQASSNVYLTGSSRLAADHEELLGLLGWRAPDRLVDEPELMPANWTWPRVHGDWPGVVEVVTTTIVGVFGFTEHLPVTMRTFGCDQPCRGCSFPDEHETATNERGTG